MQLNTGMAALLAALPITLAACGDDSATGSPDVDGIADVQAPDVDGAETDGHVQDPGGSLDQSVPDVDIEDTGTDGSKDEAGEEVETPPDAEDQTDESETVTPAKFAVAITAPTDGETVTGPVEVRIAPVDAPWLVLDSLSVKVNGAVVLSDTKVPTSFVLDTAQHPNGPTTIEAVGALGPFDAFDSVKLTIANPEFQLKSVYPDDYLYANGEMIKVNVSTGKPWIEVAADFSKLDSAFAPGDEDVFEIGGGKYLVSYTISAENTTPDGEYPITITVGDGEFLLTSDQLSVSLRNLPSLPVRVGGGLFVPDALPEPTVGWQQPIGKVDGNEYIITGGSAKLEVDFSAFKYPNEISGIIVGVDGYSGYYQRPVAASSGKEEVLLLLRTYLEGEEPPAKLGLKIAVRDARGSVSQYKDFQMNVKSVGSGDIQVSISWDTPTDVDLHVVEPNGCELYYAWLQCSSGGWLDLDSNPGCMMDNINNENVYWPEGKAPIGTYIVRVDFYEDCGFDGANYTVTVHACGNIDLYEGHFDPGTADMGDAGSGKTVAIFSNENCGRVVRGRLRYEDRAFDRFGFVTSTWRPVRHALVELYRSDDHALLAKGYSDRWGNYEIQFANKKDPGIYIVVKSETDIEEGLHPIKVLNHPKFQVVYSLSSSSVDESEEEFPVINLDIPAAVGAGAFNILDVLTNGYDQVRLMTGKDLGPLYSFWATGTDTTDTLYCSKFFYDSGVCTQMSALSVQGKDTDRDEYDDMVILKEFFKFALEKVSLDANPGGPWDGTWDDPNRAWSEGVSTFFACDVRQYPHFVNSRPSGVYLVDDVEAMTTPFAYGTSDGLMAGPVSPFLVSAVLYDLADDAGEETGDVVHGHRLGVYDSIFNYFPTFHLADRGVEGVDFVDFLDGWFCREWGDEAGVTSMVVEARQFPYDFGGPDLCIH